MICGIDEAGRGPLAGPVYAAAVILNDDFPSGFLNDSKKLSPAKRDQAEKEIRGKAFAWGIGFASHTEIDKINILQASLLAMKRAYDDMRKRHSELRGKETLSSGAAREIEPLLSDGGITVIVDGKFTPDINARCQAMIKADAQIPEVMAASILAKNARDRFMEEMSLLYPQYGYEKHKGYPTKAHREAVLKYGPSPIQRLSFNVK